MISDATAFSISNFILGGTYHAAVSAVTPLFKSKVLAAAIPGVGASFLVGGLSTAACYIPFRFIEMSFEGILEHPDKKTKLICTGILVASVFACVGLCAGIYNCTIGGGILKSYIYAGYQLALPVTLVMGSAIYSLNKVQSVKQNKP